MGKCMTFHVFRKIT